jgi:hypothetical protein
MNNELRNIIIGISETTTGHSIQTVLRFLKESNNTSRKTKKSKLLSKTDEVELLRDFADKNQFWFNKISPNSYICLLLYSLEVKFNLIISYDYSN